MITNKPWNWDKVNEGYWMTPSEDIYYLVHRWQDKGYESVLDLGCGMGRHTLLFAENGFKATGYDLSDSGLKVLRGEKEKRGLELDVIKGDVVNLPFSDRSFDTALAYHSVYHVDTAGMMHVISEIKRVIRPGGEVYLTLISKKTYSYTAGDSVYVDQNVRMKKEEDGTTLPHFYVNYDDILELFSDFEIIRIRQIEDILGGYSSWHYFLLLGV